MECLPEDEHELAIRGVSMTEEIEPRCKGGEGQPRRVRLPGFLIDEEIGLGDVIKKLTYAMRIRHCAGCERRAAVLNRWMRFTR